MNETNPEWDAALLEGAFRALDDARHWLAIHGDQGASFPGHGLFDTGRDTPIQLDEIVRALEDAAHRIQAILAFRGR